MLFEPASASSFLAFFTTIHLALAALRNHRSATTAPFSSLTVVSLALAALPWIFPSLYGLGFGLLAHVAWFGACERFAPLAAKAAPAPPVAPVRFPGTTQPPSSAAAIRSSSPPRGFVQTPVVALVDETPDIRTIRMLRPDGFQFEAGQFIPIRIRVDGREYVRCYSISSAPHSDGYLEVSVKRQGLVSNALHATARSGSILSIKAPNGAFKYPSADDRPLLLLAGGVGITPLMSMLRHAVHTEPTRRVTLLYSAAEETGFAFRDELDSLARRHPQVKVVYCLTRQPAPAPTYYPGRIDAALLRTAVPDASHSIAMLCGPAQMIDGLKALLLDIGVPTSQIRHEVFEAAVAASAGAHAEGDAHVGKVGRRSSAAAAGAGNPVQVRCLPGGQTMAVAPGQSLLEAAESCGVEIPSLCRAGVCGTCRVRITEGDVACETTTLDASELGQGYVLACVAQPLSNCTVQR